MEHLPIFHFLFAQYFLTNRTPLCARCMCQVNVEFIGLVFVSVQFDVVLSTPGGVGNQNSVLD